MLKIQPLLIITYSQRNYLIKSTFRNFTQIIGKPKSNNWIYFEGHKYPFQKASFFNATQRCWLTKLTGSTLAQKPPSLPNNLLNEVHWDDPEKREEELNIVKLLSSHGCSEEDIKTKCLPYIINTDNAYFKLKLLTALHSNIVMLMPLLSCHINSLKIAAKHCNHDNNIIGFPNRIEYLSVNLEIQPIDLIPLLSKHPSLLTMPFQRMQAKLKILKDAQIGSQYIVKDLWIFNYNEKLLEKRCFAACKAKVELKPWMLRCSEKFFDSLLIKWSETQEILKGDDEVSYLAKKLDCSENYVKVMMEKNKLLKTINIPKLERVINLLKDKGYKSQEIRLFPRIFCSSIETLNKRFEELHKDKLQGALPTLSQLCMSSKVFDSKHKKQTTPKVLKKKIT